MIKRTNSGVYMISTSRHPACLMALAVRRISASATLTAFMWEKTAGPIRRALEQFGDETANPPALPWPGALMRKLRFLAVGFLFMLFSQAFEDRYFTKREILSACLERSLGDPCDDELLSANNPRPEIRRDQANQWAEHCESNCDARN